jgi:two-component system sensor histidine kinase UhpB
MGFLQDFWERQKDSSVVKLLRDFPLLHDDDSGWSLPSPFEPHGSDCHRMITERRRLDKNVLWVLASGFGLTILLFLGSGYFSIQATQAAEARSEALLNQHRISTRVINEIQGEGAGLSGLFYVMAAGRQVQEPAELLRRLSTIEEAVHRTLQAARSGADPERWTGAKVAVENFITEARKLLSDPSQAKPPPSFYHAHEELSTEISKLVTASYQTAIEEEALVSADHRRQLHRALILLGIALGCSIACALATITIAVKAFHRLTWQAGELSRLSAHVIEGQEQILRQFSRELHDEFAQGLTAIEANLATVPTDSPDAAARVEDCTLLVKDLMGNIRELSQLLRPSGLDDFGLAPCLQMLSESFSQRTSVAVERQIEFEGRLPGQTETHLYRIAQEALTNVARHSGATLVRISLAARENILRLVVADNGPGMKRSNGGFGLAGMRERMHAAGGNLWVLSGSQGVTVVAEVRLGDINRAERDKSPARG